MTAEIPELNQPTSQDYQQHIEQTGLKSDPAAASEDTWGTTSYHGDAIEGAQAAPSIRANEHSRVPTTLIANADGQLNRALIKGSRTLGSEQYTDLDVLPITGEPYAMTAKNSELTALSERRSEAAESKRAAAGHIGQSAVREMAPPPPRLTREEINVQNGLPADYHYAKPRPQVVLGAQEPLPPRSR